MAYLAQPTSITEYGLVKIGNNITVEDGTISVPELIAGPGITLETSADSITISATGADIISVYGTTSNYTATADDEYIGVNSSSPVTITLPLGIDGRMYIVKDEYGKGGGKITLLPQTGEKIDGRSNYVISVPNQSVSVVFRAGSWRII